MPEDAAEFSQVVEASIWELSIVPIADLAGSFGYAFKASLDSILCFQILEEGSEIHPGGVEPDAVNIIQNVL